MSDKQPSQATGGSAVGRFYKKVTASVTGVGVDWRAALLVPFLALITALVVGAVIIALTDLEAMRLWFSEPGRAFSMTWSTIVGGYKARFVGSVGSLRAISETLVAASGLILAGLAVALGFRAGLFNIGVTGQMLVGGMFALFVGFTVQLPAPFHIPLALLAVLPGVIQCR